MYKIVKFDISNKELSKLAFDIRNEVFVIQQSVDPKLEYDEFEDIAIHYLAYADNIPVATARWRHTDYGIKLERFATLENYRNKGVGSAILKEVLKDVSPHPVIIYLHAQLPAVAFYERYGFIKEGDIFYEANMAHFKMVYSKKELKVT
jgi:predicted GNAT family N-acyltransferase